MKWCKRRRKRQKVMERETENGGEETQKGRKRTKWKRGVEKEQRMRKSIEIR